MDFKLMDLIVKMEQIVKVLIVLIIFVESQSQIMKILIFLKMVKIVLLKMNVSPMFALIKFAMETKKFKNFVSKIMTAKAFFAMIINALKLNLEPLLYRLGNFAITIINANQILAFKEYAMVI